VKSLPVAQIALLAQKGLTGIYLYGLAPNSRDRLPNAREVAPEGLSVLNKNRSAVRG
jgi:hypothetical protein